MSKNYNNKTKPSVEIKVTFDPETNKCEKTFTVVLQRHSNAISED